MRTSLDSITPPKRPALVAADRSSTPLKPAQPVQEKVEKKKRRERSSRPIEINISLPEKIVFPKVSRKAFRALTTNLKKIPRRVYFIMFVLVVIAGIGAFTLYLIDQQRKTGTYTTITENGTKVTELNKEQPTYNTLLPAGKSITDLGGWTRVSPPERNAVFAYVDHIGKVQINVSEQPLPDGFKEDLSNQIAYLAKGYHADVKIDANGTDVYIGTSAKGPQSVIFTKNNLLILIKATSQIANDDWATYINALR